MTQKYWPVYRVPPAFGGHWGHPAVTNNHHDEGGHDLDKARHWLREEIERDARHGAAEEDPVRYAIILAMIPAIVPGQIVRFGMYEYTILEEKP